MGAGPDLIRRTKDHPLRALPGFLIGEPVAGVLIQHVGARHLGRDGFLGLGDPTGQALFEPLASVAQGAAQGLRLLGE